MANLSSGSASSCDECAKAPDNFHVSTTSNEDEDDGVGLMGHGKSGIKSQNQNETKCCPLCRTQQRRFHCRNCVKNGNIVHSGSGGVNVQNLRLHRLTHQHRESLSEKQQKYLSIHAGLKVFSQRYDQFIATQKTTENIQFAIKSKREQLELLQKLISDKRKRLQVLTEQRDELHRANTEKRTHLPKYPMKVKALGDFVFDRIEKIDKLRERNQMLLSQLQRTTRRSVHQLVEYIFPITEIVLKDEQRQRAEEAIAATAARNVQQKSTESESIAAAIADAKNTSYIRGKWVFHGSGISEMQYRIVGPSLPANGDYTAYLDWLSDNKDDVPKTMGNETTPSRVNAFRIVAALTYTTQLMQLLCFQLNVRLPHKLAYGDFCKKLNEEQFMRKVSRLNSNIMYLAYTQQVRLRTLNENHTLENILAILDLDKSNLGRHGYHDLTNAPLIKSVDSLLFGIETATESESEDDNSIRLEWEALPHLPPQPESINSILIPPTGQQSTIAEGLITSAANRITSLLRWIK